MLERTVGIVILVALALILIVVLARALGVNLTP